MTTKTGDEKRGCTFFWKIKNISHSWVKNECIDSPRFIAGTLENTKWLLRLYFSGDKNVNHISFHLNREKECFGPEEIIVNFQVAILDKEGSILKEITCLQLSYKKNGSCDFTRFEERLKFLFSQKETFLHEDTLTVQCTIWNTEEKPVKTENLYSQTVYNVKRRNFIWRIDEFSTLKSDIKNIFKDSLVEFDLLLNNGVIIKKKLIIHISSISESIKYFSLKISTLKSDGTKENLANHECFENDLKIGLLFTLLFSKKLTENRSLYLPNDVLSLYCEYAYSNGAVSYEHCGYGATSFDVIDKVVESRTVLNIGKQETQNPGMLVHDLKFMYNDAILSDIKICTLTQTFPAHKAVLSAGSPVFRNMFSNEMKEKIRGQVDITDFEDDTIHRMLLYMYTDVLEDLQFENVYKLYAIADKYQILSLKSRCCSYLKHSLSSTRACKVLILADLHQDSDLKCLVESYVLTNYKEVFGSEEWKDLMSTNIKLAADLMYKGYFHG